MSRPITYAIFSTSFMNKLNIQVVSFELVLYLI